LVSQRGFSDKAESLGRLNAEEGKGGRGEEGKNQYLLFFLFSPSPLLIRFFSSTNNYVMRVLISGYYGYGNLGDEALLSGIITGLKNYGHDVTVLSGNPEYTKQLHTVKAVSRYKGLPLALLQHQVVISGGGGLLQDKTSSRSLQYYLGVLSLAKRLGKKTIVYGQSIGPLSESGKRAVASSLKGVSVAVRDEMSQGLLSKLGIESELVADGALLLRGGDEEMRSNLEKTSLHPLTSSFPVLLFPRAGYPAITTALTKLAQTLIAKGHAVTGVSIQPNEDRHDLETIRAAVPGFTILEATSPQDLVQLISQSRYVVSGRLHGLILAAVANVNFCGLVYDPKVAAFLSEAGAASFTLPVDQQRLIQSVLEQIPVDWGSVETLKKRAERGLEWLQQQLSTSK
jgi:polysaccharide pyruvyl transferase CsaB